MLVRLARQTECRIPFIRNLQGRKYKCQSERIQSGRKHGRKLYTVLVPHLCLPSIDTIGMEKVHTSWKRSLKLHITRTKCVPRVPTHGVTVRVIWKWEVLRISIRNPSRAHPESRMERLGNNYEGGKKKVEVSVTGKRQGREGFGKRNVLLLRQLLPKV